DRDDAIALDDRRARVRPDDHAITGDGDGAGERRRQTVVRGEAARATVGAGAHDAVRRREPHAIALPRHSVDGLVRIDAGDALPRTTLVVRRTALERADRDATARRHHERRDVVRRRTAQRELVERAFPFVDVETVLRRDAARRTAHADAAGELRHR